MSNLTFTSILLVVRTSHAEITSRDQNHIQMNASAQIRSLIYRCFTTRSICGCLTPTDIEASDSYQGNR